MIVYLSIGNSDDKLTQFEWSSFVHEVARDVARRGHVHGEWFSLPQAAYQNACWCIEFSDAANESDARQAASRLRKSYGQDSVAWAVAETEFI